MQIPDRDGIELTAKPLKPCAFRPRCSIAGAFTFTRRCSTKTKKRPKRSGPKRSLLEAEEEEEEEEEAAE